MQRISLLASTTAAAAIFTLVGCSTLNHRATQVESAGEVDTGPITPPNNRTIPAGAMIVATLDQALGTKTSKAGDSFVATVSDALLAKDGSVVVPAGAKINGHVTALDASSNATQPALIRLAFDNIRFSGSSYPFTADIVKSNPVQSSSQSSAERTRQIVIGGAVGAALGAILGGKDLDKIVIGGAIGAAAGSIISLGTDVNATLPAGSSMTVRATQTIMLR